MIRPCLLLFCSTALVAQTFDRTHPPAAAEPRPFKLPPVYETKLANGLTVMLVQDDRVPLVTARLAFRCGNRRDPADTPGLAAAVAELITQSTARVSTVQIAEALDGTGGTLNATAGADHLSIDGSIPTDSLPVLLTLFGNVAASPEFSDIDLRLYRQNRRQTLLRQYTQTSFAANTIFRQALFQGHPYSHIAPTPDSLDRLSRQALLEYREKWLVPNNAILLLVGRLPDRADTMKLITDRFGLWEERPLPQTTAVPLPKPAAKRILVDNPGAAQADVRMGKIAATQHDPDYFAEITGSVIVGGVPIGRMFLDLREKKGFVYDVRTDHAAFDEAGILSATTQVRNEVAGEAIEDMLDHLNRMASEPVSEKELADAKISVAGSFLLGLETQAGLADELMVAWIQGLPASWLETWRTRLEAVKADEIQAAAKKYMATQDNVLIVVGDAAKIQGALTKIGKFEVNKVVR
jgi:zinc protease